ncbi:hypothetical protein C8Q76DRAFT_860361 [Earliella scabrosa]|nr:hypothetical protein C8Q76DRAFT_860361 [Earliella scabrosa]
MSDNAEALRYMEAIDLAGYLSCVAATLIAYETAITFDREVKAIWKQKITAASVIFLLNRYVPLVVNLLYSPYPQHPSNTQKVGLLSIIGIISKHVTVSRVTIISRSCLIISDLLVIGITWKATLSSSRTLNGMVHTTSISSILFRDGMMYFSVLFILNVIHLTFSLISVSTELYGTSSVFVLIEPITAVLISRFILDLQEANNGSSRHGESASAVTTVMFERVVGSLASSLPALTKELANKLLD